VMGRTVTAEDGEGALEEPSDEESEELGAQGTSSHATRSRTSRRPPELRAYTGV